MWDDQMDVLSERFTVVRYDLRGFGRSPASTESYAHADDLLALLDRLGLGAVDLVGLSLGGGAAINFAILHPNRVRRMVVVDPSLGGFKWSAGFGAAQAALRAAITERGIEGGREAWLAMPIFRETLARPAAAARLRAQVADYSGWHWSHPDVGRALTPPAIDRLGSIAAPTLVVVGERDVPDCHAIADTLARGIAGARKVVIPGAGHLANMDEPEAFNRALLDFLTDARS
jgi:3-oxoadipate enol-lactonase